MAIILAIAIAVTIFIARNARQCQAGDRGVKIADAVLIEGCR